MLFFCSSIDQNIGPRQFHSDFIGRERYDNRNGKLPKLTFDAWFHFHPGGTAADSVLHHFLRITSNPADAVSPSQPPAERMTLERKLFRALHANPIHSPSIKEFKKSWAMANAVRTFLKDGSRMEVVLDVAGKHGTLGALFLTHIPRVPGCGYDRSYRM